MQCSPYASAFPIALPCSQSERFPWLPVSPATTHSIAWGLLHVIPSGSRGVRACVCVSVCLWESLCVRVIVCMWVCLNVVVQVYVYAHTCVSTWMGALKYPYIYPEVHLGNFCWIAEFFKLVGLLVCEFQQNVLPLLAGMTEQSFSSIIHSPCFVPWFQKTQWVCRAVECAPPFLSLDLGESVAFYTFIIFFSAPNNLFYF